MTCSLPARRIRLCGVRAAAAAAAALRHERLPGGNGGHDVLFVGSCGAQALRLFSAVIIVPTMQIAWTLVSIVSGMVFYQEYKGMSALKSGMFAVGVVVSPLLMSFSISHLTSACFFTAFTLDLVDEARQASSTRAQCSVCSR